MKCPECGSENIQCDCETIFHCRDCGTTWIGHEEKVGGKL